MKSEFSLGDLCIYPQEGRIKGPQGSVHVRPKVMEVLMSLADRAGNVVSREELIESVWGHTFGADEALTRCISDLRQSLGESTRNPRFLETIPKRGYRLIGLLESSVLDQARLAYPEPPRPPLRSVAVLPFINVGKDPKHEYFSDGMSDELLNTLGKQPDLRVAARTSSFSFKGKSADIREIGQQMNVEYILEGSVYMIDDSLRVTVQLISVEDGCNIWSESYNRKIEHVFSIQEEIAENIADALKIKLIPHYRDTIHQASTNNLDAYDFYLRGRSHFQSGVLENVDLAREMFSRAIELDANYAKAWAGLGDCESIRFLYLESCEYRKEATTTASRRAVELAPQLSDSHVSLGLAYLITEEYAKADQEFEIAIRLDPGLFEAYYYYGRACIHQGRLADAARMFEKAAEVRPEDFQTLFLLVVVNAAEGLHHKAIKAAHRGLAVAEQNLRINPEDDRAYYLGAHAWWHIGEENKALAWAERALTIAPESPMTLYNLACLYSKMSKYDEALKYLEQSRMPSKSWVENDPDLKPLHKYDRFQELLKTLC